MMPFTQRIDARAACALTLLLAACSPSSAAEHANSAIVKSFGGLWAASKSFMTEHCLDCHGPDSAEAGLDLAASLGSATPASSGEKLSRWIQTFDRIESGEMPPDGVLDEEDRQAFVSETRKSLADLESAVLGPDRAVWRRMNRFEYENSLRDLLHAPWLEVAQGLPADPESHLFNKVGTALDTSHVQIARYLQVSEQSLRSVVAPRVDAIDPKPVRYYARRQPAFARRLRYNEFNRSPERAVFPLLDHEPDLAVLDDEDAPPSLVQQFPERIESEAFGVVASSYEPLEIQFDEFRAPESGRYKLRFNAYSFWAGPGVDGPRWWRPNRRVASKGRRDEPVSLYSRSPPRVLRKLTSFDVTPEPSVHEVEVVLLKGETIQVDAARLFRSRPPGWHNPLATQDGQPGVAFKWMEAEGPLHTQWPTAGHKTLFGDLPITNSPNDSLVNVVVNDDASNQRTHAEALLTSFLEKAYRRPIDLDNENDRADLERFLNVFDASIESGQNFRDAMITAYSAVLCSPEFVSFREPAGRIDDDALATRLSFFLTNSPPDEQLWGAVRKPEGFGPTDIRVQASRLLSDDRSQRFVSAFLDYWLDLRKLTDTSPDERLYPDYYLDDLLIDSTAEETRAFFRELIDQNLPISTLVDSNFVFVNERLADHYGIPSVHGVQLRRVELPTNSIRGGLLTQASLLKVTANGSTTSPVQRGAWVMERILGEKPSPPPPDVPAIEPDTRGAVTIRQQLDLHRNSEACAPCHRKIDPPGFALECFDVLGGFRERYRAMPEEETETNASDNSESLVNYVAPKEGYGKNGQPFRFQLAHPVDGSGVLPSGESFTDILELKRLLASRPRTLARNLTNQLIVYSTGSPIRFRDREPIERMLDRLEPDNFPIRSMILEIVGSDLFQTK